MRTIFEHGEIAWANKLLGAKLLFHHNNIIVLVVLHRFLVRVAIIISSLFYNAIDFERDTIQDISDTCDLGDHQQVLDPLPRHRSILGCLDGISLPLAFVTSHHFMSLSTVVLI